MPCPVRDVMWSRALVALARGHRVQQGIFQPTTGGQALPGGVLETNSGLAVVLLETVNDAIAATVSAGVAADAA